MNLRAIVLGCIAGLSVGLTSPLSMACGEPSTRLAVKKQDQAEGTIARAIAFLRAKQDKGSGGWSIPAQGPAYPAITALIVRGMMMQPGITQDDPSVGMGVKFVLNQQQPDGGIYDKVLPSYNTSICVVALSRVDTPQAKDAVKRAVDFLKSIQFGENAVVRDGVSDSAKPVGKDDPFYGGWGYGRHGRPDLSNSAWAIEALHAAGVEPTDDAFKRALVFLQRTQMVDQVSETKINDMPYAKGSTQGGFVYATSVSGEKVGVGQSPAGEVAESLSGGPGTVVLMRLATSAPKKVRTLPKAEVEARLHASANKYEEVLGKGFVVLLGPSGDGSSSSTFEIRLATPNRNACVEAMKGIFSGELTAFSRPDGGPEIKLLPAILNDSDARNEQASRQAFAEVDGMPNVNEGILCAFPTPAWKGESRLRAYGSMTYSGFKSYLYANLSKDDPRVTEALRWLGENYSVRENPGMGTDGLYYYYVVMARALDAWNSPTLATTPGGEKRWAEDLVDRLTELQAEDGSFKSVDDRWLESDPVLITAYSLLALQYAVHRGE